MFIKLSNLVSSSFCSGTPFIPTLKRMCVVTQVLANTEDAGEEILNMVTQVLANTEDAEEEIINIDSKMNLRALSLVSQ